MVTSIPREPTIDLRVSWDGSGDFDGAHDLLTGPNDPRLLKGTLTATRGRNAPRGSAGGQAATIGAALDNRDRLFSNEYPGSDLYLQVEPDRPTKLEMAVGADVAYDADIPYDAPIPYTGIATLPVATGYLEEPLADSARGNKVLSISALGLLSKLRGIRVTTALYTAITTGDFIKALLDAAGIAYDPDLIATGDTTLDYAWADDEDLLDKIDSIVATEGVPSYFGETADGLPIFQNRNWRANDDRSLISQATFRDRFSADPLALYHQGVTVVPARADIVNEATVRIVRRANAASVSLQKVWEYGQSLTLAGNEVRDIDIAFSDPVTDLTAPVEATDYTVASGSLLSAPTLVATYAQRATVRFEADISGATINGVTSNGPQIRAKPLAVLSEETVTDEVPARAIDTARGPKPKQIQALPEISRANAVAIADAEVLYSRDPRPIVTVTVANKDAHHTFHQLWLDVGWRITVLSEHHGYTEDTHQTIEQIQHRREGALLVTTFVCQRAFAERGTGLWAIDDEDDYPGVALWGEDDEDITPGVGQWSP